MVRRAANLALAFGLLVLGRSTSAHADPWDKVIGQLADGAQVVERSEQLLRVGAPGTKATLILGTGPGMEADIWSETRRRRGRNPYRVWFVGQHLLHSKMLPKRDWPRFLRVGFLRLLRVGARPPQYSMQRRD